MKKAKYRKVSSQLSSAMIELNTVSTSTVRSRKPRPISTALYRHPKGRLAALQSLEADGTPVFPENYTGFADAAPAE